MAQLAGMVGLLLVLTAASPVLAAPADPDPAKAVGMSILDLRKELLGRKWPPRPLPYPDPELADNDSVAADLRRDGLAEVQYCGLTGLVPCIFNYRKGARCLMVRTRGEYFPVEDISPHVEAVEEQACTD